MAFDIWNFTHKHEIGKVCDSKCCGLMWESHSIQVESLPMLIVAEATKEQWLEEILKEIPLSELSEADLNPTGYFYVVSYD